MVPTIDAKTLSACTLPDRGSSGSRRVAMSSMTTIRPSANADFVLSEQRPISSRSAADGHPSAGLSRCSVDRYSRMNCSSPARSAGNVPKATACLRSWSVIAVATSWSFDSKWAQKAPLVRPASPIRVATPAMGQLAAVGQILSVPFEQVRSNLRRIKQPVLYANGVHDVMIPALASYVPVQHLDSATLVLYSDAGHAFPFQHARALATEVTNFLAA
jgi:pimeloyl-ACP methyl ester carboxylesterase